MVETNRTRFGERVWNDEEAVISLTCDNVITQESPSILVGMCQEIRTKTKDIFYCIAELQILSAS